MVKTCYIHNLLSTRMTPQNSPISSMIIIRRTGYAALMHMVVVAIGGLNEVGAAHGAWRVQPGGCSYPAD
jgi:hypothetical protein